MAETERGTYAKEATCIRTILYTTVELVRSGPSASPPDEVGYGAPRVRDPSDPRRGVGWSW